MLVKSGHGNTSRACSAKQPYKHKQNTMALFSKNSEHKTLIAIILLLTKIVYTKHVCRGNF